MSDGIYVVCKCGENVKQPWADYYAGKEPICTTCQPAKDLEDYGPETAGDK